ncbi:GNAT family N-acetyltransferase [Altererythrobacter arenosus]|uniref:GNAT family N-acetyltransferase n=1 Tax=Altererythrobacter arenosus TaxID=3032592 RepID=A0ABY8FP38_9SPHN|nr:GNAT family N-acetyltransferase [Altererythrobacter sp. CAU 1644]WFL76030.1 GNAT family N-acetyltransferase [Altererythrobacter sp. CAU 1644]
MTAISISRVHLDGLSTLADIGRRTFEQTFASGNNPEDFSAYLSRAFSHEQLSLELSNPGSRFYFAETANGVAGYLKVNHGSAQTETVEGKTLEIERIYVDTEMQGTGVGKALFQFALEEARAIGADAVWLGVWEANPKAIEFYSRQGFTAFGEHSFAIGNDLQRDILMRRELRDWDGIES